MNNDIFRENFYKAGNKIKEVDSKILIAVNYQRECAKSFYLKKGDKELKKPWPVIMLFRNFDKDLVVLDKPSAQVKEDMIADFIVKNSVPHLI